MMKMTELQQKITAALPAVKILPGEPMSRHTSFHIGGAAEVMAFPENPGQLAEILQFAGEENVKYAILGAGTNVLAPDEGLEGIIICLKDCLDGMEQLPDNRIRVYAGVTMTRAAVYAAGLGLGGMEFAHGIPGTVGGGVYMNAGAYGGEIVQICESVDVMQPDGSIVTYACADMDFSYRHSRLEEEPGIVISTVFKLTPKPEEEIRAQMRELMNKRKASQPLELPSAGSAFKRPVGGFAAALIDQAGLKGFQVGGAAVSEKHAGFAVNLGGATAADVLSLLEQVSDKVFEFSGIRLEPEIRLWKP